MKISRFLSGTQPKVGLQTDAGILDIEGVIHYLPPGTESLQTALLRWLLRYPGTDWVPIRQLIDWLRLNDGNFEIDWLSPASISYLAPVERSGKIICVGKNYQDGNSADTQTYPTLFLKAGSTLTGHQHPIRLPAVSEQVFSEAELAVVIGKAGKHLTRESSWEHIAGFTIANDTGALDLENRTSQWQSGKLPDTFLPMGPVLVSPDEIGDTLDLNIRLYINREPVIDGSTTSMIFDVPNIIQYVSSIATLYPGDVILTGCPKPKLGRGFIHPGDLVEVEIEKIGTLINPVVKEKYP